MLLITAASGLLAACSMHVVRQQRKLSPNSPPCSQN